jgi:chemotaxis protein MotB
MCTFADLMSLLLCFFVLLLSFSELDRQKFKEIAGALAQAFGVQRKILTYEMPKGEKIIAKQFDMEAVATREREELGERLAAEIKTQLRQTEGLIDIKASKDGVVIRMMGETTFDLGRADIKPAMEPVLIRIGEMLEKSKGDILIAGHTDNVPVSGKYRSNLELSLERARAVTEFLLAHTNLDPKRIATMGYGEFRPIAPNDSPEGRQKNRRVEIILTTLPYRVTDTGEVVVGGTERGQ